MDINVLILGKSGAGKSSLLNYLWGIEKAKTGIGKPVTEKGKTGIHVHEPVLLNGHNVIISDSWGLEADKADEWLKTVMPTLEKHESSPNVEDWFHTVIYCIGASGARIEPFETKEVVLRLQKAGHTVVFALTKADRANKEELDGLRKVIRKDCPNNGGIINIESLNETLRNGKTTERRGKDQMLNVITENLSAKLQRKLAVQYLAKCRVLCEEWKWESLRTYDKEAGFFTRASTTMEKVSDDAEYRLHLMTKELETWRKLTTAKLEEFQVAFGKAVSQSVADKDFTFRPVVAPINEWNGILHAANAVMYLIPVIGQIWPFINTGIFRDELAEKLDVIVDKIVEEATSHIPTEWRAEAGSAA